MHKVLLFADDLLIFISDPLTCIPKNLKLLKDFVTFSGYKLNLHKNKLIPNTAADECSLSSPPFKVSLKKFTYLGIVTRKHKDLFKYNFLPLLDCTKLDLDHWPGLPLSLAGHINAVKMNILPKFLYLFQSVPVYIFLLVRSTHFIIYMEWKNTSYTQNCPGGMALPNFQYYY